MNKSIRVLHLEDSPRDAELVRLKLDSDGVASDVVWVNGKEGFESKLYNEIFDIILCDHNLPGYDGKTALLLSRSKDPLVPVIILSGTLGEEEAVDCLKQGATDYVLKHRLERLTPAIRRALQEADERRARNKAEESLRASEHRFQEVADHVGEWVWEVDFEGLYTYSSPVVEQSLGYRPEELVGRIHFYDLYPPEEMESLKKATLEHFNSRKPFVRFTNQLVHRDGHIVLMETSGTPLLDAEGRLLGYRGMDTDITEREKTEQKIRSQAALLDLAQDAIVVQDLNGQITYWNKSCERLTQWSAAEAVGRPFPELVRPDPEQLKLANERVLEKSQWTGELELARKDGTPLTIMSRWTLMRNEKDKPTSVLIINTDITEQKKLEAQFLRAQRLEGLGALAGGIAHDLNNILSPILMVTSVLRTTTTDADGIDMISTIESSARRGADIIKQLLTFARGKPDVRVTLPTRHFLQDMNKIIRETFPRDITPKLEIGSDLWPIVGDGTQFHQVLLNLCVNARDAMPDGGVLTLGAKNVTLDEAFACTILEARPGNFVCISVSDTGTGISAENLERIFDPFFTTKEIGKGTGLGLATVLGIVRGHEGFVRVNSEIGAGTTFEIYFPAAEQSQTTKLIALEKPSPYGHGECILVVDDEAPIRNSLRIMLENNGYRVMTAANGAEGLMTYTQHQPQIRAVLTDMMMPVMNGPAFVTTLRVINPGVLILGMSGLSDRAGVKGLDSLELSTLLTKPFSGDELLHALDQALRSSPGCETAHP